MVRARGHALQLSTRYAADGDVRVPCDLKNLAQARLVRALGHDDALDGARARAQSFEHGLHAEEVRAVVRVRLYAHKRLSARLLTRRFGRAVRRPCEVARRALSLSHTRGAFALAPSREGASDTLARRLAIAHALPGIAHALLTTAHAMLTVAHAMLTTAHALLIGANTIPLTVLAVLGSALAMRACALVVRLVAAARAPPLLLLPTPVSAVVFHELSARARSTKRRRNRA
jgi:hypothetical protein